VHGGAIRAGPSGAFKDSAEPTKKRSPRSLEVWRPRSLTDLNIEDRFRAVTYQLKVK
jgi:hypothetical protein